MIARTDNTFAAYNFPAPVSRPMSPSVTQMVFQAAVSRNMHKSISQLLKGIQHICVEGDDSRIIRRITADSRRVIPGSLFVAISGQVSDGHNYLEQAINAGAVAVATEKPATLPTDVTRIHCANTRKLFADAACRFFEHPDQRVCVTGVTGTNGKTTTCNLAKYLISEYTDPCGMLGTIAYDLGYRSLPAARTTPDAVEINAFLAEMANSGVSSAIMEVSSHALEQHRVRNIQYDTAVFLNLTQDHIDYHGDMDRYFLAKQKLFNGFTGKLPRRALINIDDPHGRRLLSSLPVSVDVLTFSCRDFADFMAKNISLTSEGASFDFCYPGGEISLHSPLLGEYNVSNAVAALAIAFLNGVPMERAALKLERFPGVPGRMERIEEGQDFTVLVDYAHTDDAIRNALSMLQKVVRNRIHIVFGCGGNRDRKKRPLMMQAAIDQADEVWVTADNPRGEELDQIFSDMLQVTNGEKGVHCIPDRRKAISMALSAASEGDCVLIAGKGHETYQEFAETIMPFDDRAVAREILRVTRQTRQVSRVS